MLVQERLQSHRCNAVEPIAPAGVGQFPTGLRLDFIAGNGLLAVHTLAHTSIHGSQIGVFAVWATPFDNPIGLEGHLAAAWSSIGNNSHPPGISSLLRQPAGIEQGGLTSTVGAGHLASLDKSSMVVLGDVELRENLRTIL